MAMILHLQKSPDDEQARSEYHDYLLDHKRDVSAAQVRQGFTPGLGDYRAKVLSVVPPEPAPKKGKKK
jgi:hypothetical protein